MSKNYAVLSINNEKAETKRILDISTGNLHGCFQEFSGGGEGGKGGGQNHGALFSSPCHTRKNIFVFKFILNLKIAK
jgi:hypothetical protein